MASRGFGWGDFFARFAFAVVLVACTYNPEGFSYWHWVFADLGAFNAIKALVGLVLAIGWVIYLRATLRSLGPIGLALALAVFGCLIWVMVDFGLLKADSMRAMVYACMFVLAAVMGVGMSWSHVRRRLSGQVDADDVDE